MNYRIKSEYRANFPCDVDVFTADDLEEHIWAIADGDPSKYDEAKEEAMQMVEETKHFTIELERAEVHSSVLAKELRYKAIEDYPETIHSICERAMCIEEIGSFCGNSIDEAIKSFREEAASQRVLFCGNGSYCILETVSLAEDDGEQIEGIDFAEMSHDDCIELHDNLFGDDK